MTSLAKRYLLIALIAAVLAACSPVASAAGPQTQIDNPYAPQSGDAGLVKEDVRLVKTEVTSQSGPSVQYSLKISFFMPTPCDQFRVTVASPDASRQIKIDVYSLMKSGQVCTLMATTNPTIAVIGLGSLLSGHYTVLVNGVSSAEFDV